MKKLKYLTPLFFAAYTSLFYSQNERIEIKLQNCTFNQIPENGKEIKQEIQEFENYLIEKKVLNDGSGKSYIELFQKIKEDDDINFDYRYSFSDSIQKIEISDIYKQMDCQIELINRVTHISLKLL
ncbi:hypothetical protein ABW636_21620 [Aquimarina sp. 2201CG1-2-11]|uniref:hypothetical protein n=1 Tax=Aquimarina discodermiae TaxID=3231043 RepID=UPI003463754B